MENKIIINNDLSLCNYNSFDVSNVIIREPSLHTCDIDNNSNNQTTIIKEYYYYYNYPSNQNNFDNSNNENLSIIDISCDITNISNTFLNSYNWSYQEIYHNSPVIFSNNNSINGYCFHEPNTSQFYIYKTGFYYIYVNVYPIQSSHFSLFKNSTNIIPGSTIGSIDGATQNSNVVIIQIIDDDLIIPYSNSSNGMACQIELINTTPFSQSVILYDASGYNNYIPQINASISIFLLNS